MKGVSFYLDTVVVASGDVTNGGLYFVGNNANKQRGELVGTPFPNLLDDPAIWHDFSAWVTQQGVWNVLAGVPLVLLRPDRIHPAWEFSRLAAGLTGETCPLMARDIHTDYGLAVMFPAASFTHTANTLLHIRGSYVPLT